MTTMLESLLRLHVLSLFLFCCVSSSIFFTIQYYPIDGLVSCGPRQIQALTQFKNEFDSRSCNQTTYFNGVWCDNMTGAITKLQLPSGCFTGIPNPNSSLFGFHQLRYLNLSDNNFISSSLPLEFGNLNKLEVLALSSNGFIGQIPSSFSNLSMLSILDLSRNELTGNFPLVWNLSKLSLLRLSYNHFSGPLSPNTGLFELRQLRYLSLSYNKFGSSLPYKFGNLNKLENLYLSSNGFSGQVPPTVSNLTSLTELYFYQNKLTGNFPIVQNLTKLSLLDLHDNHFTGIVPSSLITLPFLSNLNLAKNDFTGFVEVPNSSTSSRLESLYLAHNPFEGRILEPISKLITLEVLDLSYLNISYPIDFKFISSLKSLVYLILSGNNISPASLMSSSYIPLTLKGLSLDECGISEFPQFLKNCQDLEIINLSLNKIKGKIPDWFWSLTNLRIVVFQGNLLNEFEGSTLVKSSVRFLAMDGNSFEGTFPHLPLSINSFSASYNNFKGEIPLSICNRSSLAVLDLSHNNLTGPIPQCLGNLKFLTLRKNNLEGSIPDTFDIDASLRTLDVGYNRLTGKLPRSLVNCSSLEFLGVDNNKINDKFPFWLKALPKLKALILRSNKFYGLLSPPYHGPLGFPKLRIFEVSDNKFIGSLPPDYFVNWKAPSLSMNGDGSLYMINLKTTVGEFYYDYVNVIDLHYKGLSMEQAKVLKSYATIDLSGNQLEGMIPESIGLLKELIALNLSNNAFSGHIPMSLPNLKELESLDMSRNKLSGTIPSGLGSLSFLAFVNVSHNQLKGEIPQGPQMTGQHKSCFEGNAGLCGFPLVERCFEPNVSPTHHHKQEEEEAEEEEEQVLSWRAVVIGYGFGVLFGVAIAQFIASYKQEWLAKITGPKKRRNH